MSIWKPLVIGFGSAILHQALGFIGWGWERWAILGACMASYFLGRFK